MEQDGTGSNRMEQDETEWDRMGQNGRGCNRIIQAETGWNKMIQDKKKKKLDQMG